MDRGGHNTKTELVFSSHQLVITMNTIILCTSLQCIIVFKITVLPKAPLYSLRTRSDNSYYTLICTVNVIVLAVSISFS